MEKISGKDHKSIWKKDYNQNDVPESIYYNIKNKILYELTPQGIASCDGEGNAKTNIAKREQLEGLDSILRFIVDEEENIFARGRSGSTQKILKFTRTENSEESIEDKNKNYYVLRKYDYDEYFWFENIIRCDIDYYIDWDGRKANFDTKEFRNVLELLKSIKNKFMYPEHTGSDEKGLDTARKNILFYAISTGSYHWLNISNPYADSMRLLPWPWGEYTDTRTFDAYNVSINSRSQNKEEAWEFVKYLFTEDAQFYLSENNFVVNMKADEKRMAVFAEELEKYNLLGDDNIKAINDIKNILNKNAALGVPDELFNTIWDEVKTYLSGSKSPEEAAKTIQNKVELYLNE